MAPKKAALEKAIAMKAMKAMKVKKHAMKQGILKTSRALGKAKSLEKAKLNKKNLEKLGSQTLDEKIKAAIEAGESEEHSAELLKQSLTKSEHSKVWSKRKIALEKASAAERKKHEQLSKKDKGLAASKWLLEKEGKKICQCLEKGEGRRVSHKKREVGDRKADAPEVQWGGASTPSPKWSSDLAGMSNHLGDLWI